ncbi:hypothetical protein FPOAC1_003765 [Fusarium poae]|uniref:hypothetical protein n=1 Tax=Fusarium poae TaxID=36050 RepID=UPI001CEAF748|nr:hypothetical protein FPOAC1_003765 [Fusarium poae]KAG8677737.1 hypothetical protein FPOAC1_003765 [Fusarium poae]
MARRFSTTYMPWGTYGSDSDSADETPVSPKKSPSKPFLSTDLEYKDSRSEIDIDELADLEPAKQDDEFNQVLIFYISGLDGKHPKGDSPTPELDKFPQAFVFRPAFTAETLSTVDGIMSLSTQLLEFVVHKLKEPQSSDSIDPPAIIFLARDLGGSVLKKTLIKASREDNFGHIVERTTNIFFFGTPHRASSEHPWEQTMSDLIFHCPKSTCSADSLAVARSLVKIHEDLATEFDLLCSRSRLGITNYYQKSHKDLAPAVLLPRAVATLGYDNEYQIGCYERHEMLANLSRPDVETHLLSVLSILKARIKSEYKSRLNLLSRHDYLVSTFSRSTVIYGDLYEELFRSETMIQFLQRYQSVPGSTTMVTDSTEPTSGTAEDSQTGIPTRSLQSIGYSIQILELHGLDFESANFKKSLLGTILEQNTQYPNLVDFITVACDISKRAPLTKVDLLVSIARQHLILHPEISLPTDGLFNELEAALGTDNSIWKEAAIWSLVQTLLGCPESRRTFVIILVPSDEKISKVFTDLVSDILSWTSHVEISCKVLVVQGPNANLEQEVINTRAGSSGILFKPNLDCLDKVVQRMSQAIFQCPHLSLLQPHAIELFENVRLLSIEQCSSILQSRPLSSTMWSDSTEVSNADQILIDLIFDQVPQPARSWFQTGLMWVVYAVRPLAHSELVFLLHLDYDDDTISKTHFQDFLRLAIGIVEDDGFSLRLSNFGTRKLLYERLAGHGKKPGFSPQANNIAATEESGYSDEWYHSDVHPDLLVAQKCMEVLHQYYIISSTSQSDVTASGNSQDSPSTDSMNSEMRVRDMDMSPFLSYSTENLLAHIRLWCEEHHDGSNSQEALESLYTVVEVLNDHQFVNWFIQRRRSVKCDGGLSSEPFDVPNLVDLLDLSLKNVQDIMRIIKILQCLYNLNANTSRSNIFYLVIVLAQLGDTKGLSKFHDSTFGSETLRNVFQTGADTTLCYLSDRFPGFVRDNLQDIIRRSLVLGNRQLLQQLVSEYEVSPPVDVSSSEFLHSIAQIGRNILPEDIWNRFRSLYNTMSNESVTTIFHLAVRLGYIDTVGLVTSETLNKPGLSGDTLLHVAMEYGDYAIAAKLLLSGADLSPVGRCSRTPLHIACANGFSDLVNLLLRSKSSHLRISAFDEDGNTPLHLALSSHHSDAAERILSSSPSIVTPGERHNLGVNCRNSDGYTPLILAIEQGNIHMVNSLLIYGADYRIHDNKSRYPVHFSAALDDPAILIRLLEESDIQVERYLDEERNTAFHVSTSRGHFSMSKMLLSKNADRNLLNVYDRSPFSLACARGLISNIKPMVHACNPRSLANGLVEAVLAGYHDVAQLLLTSGADVNSIESKTELSVLHLAVISSDVLMVQILLLRRAKLDIIDSNGHTPLHIAARDQAVECLELLVNAGAGLDVIDPGGATALSIAIEHKHERCVDVLLNPQAEIDAEKLIKLLEVAMIEYKADVVYKMLTRFSDSEWVISDNLLLSLLKDGIEVQDKLKILFDRGLAHDHKIGDGGTMLHYAALWGQPHLVDFLIECKADLNVVHKQWGTPLQIASENGHSNALRIVKALLQANAIANIGAGFWGAPLHAAAGMPRSNEYIYVAVAVAIMDKYPETLHHIAGTWPTVLQAAIANGTTGMIDLILSRKPRFDVVAGTWGTPLHLAVKRGYYIETFFLLHDGDKSQLATRDHEGRLPHHLACQKGRSYERIGSLLKRMFKRAGYSFDPLTVDRQQRHMFHFYAAHGNHSMLEDLISESPDAIDACDIDGWTPLHWACRQGDPETIKLLIDNHANQRALTKQGYLPLDVAKHHGLDLDQNPKLLDHFEPDDIDNASSISREMFLRPVKEFINFSCDSFLCF